MKIALTSPTLRVVRSKSRSQCDFEIFLHLPQYKLSSSIPGISALAHARNAKLCLPCMFQTSEN